MANGLVEAIEQLAEEIAADQVSAIAIAIVYRDGETGAACSELPSTAAMLGAVEFMKARIMGLME